MSPTHAADPITLDWVSEDYAKRNPRDSSVLLFDGAPVIEIGNIQEVIFDSWKSVVQGA